jgi:hypothetical protein
MAAGRLDVLLGLDAAEFTSGLTKAEYEAKKFRDTLVKGGKAAAAAFGTAVVAGAVALTREIAQMVGELDDLDESAQALQTTAVALAEMRMSAGETGVEAEKLDASLTRLNVKIGEAAEAGSEASRLFQAMGVSVKDAAGKTRGTTDVLADVADVFAKLEDGPEKAALAVQLFGKAGAAMIPYLNQGADGLRRFSGLTDETVKAAAAIQAQVDELSRSWQTLKYSIAEVALPAINTIIERLRQMDFSKALEGLKDGGIFGFYRGLQEEAKRVADRQQQVADALALGAGAYSNEGRAAAQAAGDILARAAALKESEAAAKRAADATKRHAEALQREAEAIRSRNVSADFADLARIRANRERMRNEIEDDERAAREREVGTLDRLTGRTELREQAEQLRILNDAARDGAITWEEYNRGLDEVYGKLTKDIGRGADEAASAAEELGMVLVSNLGSFFKDPTPKNFFKALTEDLLQFTTKLLILEPLMESIRKAFGKGGTGSFDWGSLFKSNEGVGSFFSGVGDFFSGLVGSFASGSDFVPRDGLAMVHRGERIVTAADNRRGDSRTYQITNNWPAGTTRETAAQAGAAFARQLATVNRRYN